MAERMIAAGQRPWLWARRAEVLDRYRAAEATLAATPAQLGAACDVIGLCLYDAAATDAVLDGDTGLLARIRPGTVLAVHATVGPGYVRDLAERVAALGVRVVDAPVSGGPAAAEGRLLVVVGAEDADVARCRPMFATYSDNVVHLGAVGAAQATKLLNNALMTATAGLVFDVFELGEALGIDRDGLGAVLSGGSAACASIGYFLGAGGAQQLSANAWPTLHKDVALVEDLVAGTPLADGLLVAAAATTITTMARHRAWSTSTGQGET